MVYSVFRIVPSSNILVENYAFLATLVMQP